MIAYTIIDFTTQHFALYLHLLDNRHITFMKTPNHRKVRKLGLFSMLLALLGVGCDAVNEVIGITELMYGSRSAHFSVKGKVTDESGNPIQNIEVSLHGVMNYDGQDYAVPSNHQPVKTDTKGTYLIEMSSITAYTTVQINANDIDGSANGGEFASDSLRNSTYVFIKDKKDKDSWSIGTADITMPDIKLKKK